MLETYGLHQLIWNTADERFPDVLVASAADAEGRGIKLLVMDNGSFVDLSDARCYLIWRHRRTGVRGTEEFDNADADEGRFTVFYPASMCGHTGTVDAQIMLSLGDDRFMSTRDFVIRVERVLVDGEPRDDGFTIFVEAIRAYEQADEVASEAAENINAMEVAATALPAGSAPTVELDKTGDVWVQRFGIPAGAKGDTGPAGPQGATGATGPAGPAGAAGATGPQGPKGDTGDTGPAGAAGAKGDKGDKGDTGDTGATGPAGADGVDGQDGADGADGISCTHGWNGTVLTVTSASGTSSADLKGATGETGPAGPRVPGLFAYDAPVQVGALKNFTCDKGAHIEEDVFLSSNGTLCTVNQIQDYSATKDRVYIAGAHPVHGRGVGTCTGVELEPGEESTQNVSVTGHSIHIGDLALSTDTLCLCEVTALSTTYSDHSLCRLAGICTLGGGGAEYTFAEPLSVDGDNEVSIDLSAYATKAELPQRIWTGESIPTVNEHSQGSNIKIGTVSELAGIKDGDIILSLFGGGFGRVSDLEITGSNYYATVDGWADVSSHVRFYQTISIDADPGTTKEQTVYLGPHYLRPDTIVLNTETGNLMVLKNNYKPTSWGHSAKAKVTGIANIFNSEVDLSGYAALAGATFTGAVSGVAPTANAHLTTKAYVDGAIADAIDALDDLSEVMF